MKCITDPIVTSVDLNSNFATDGILLDQVYGFSFQVTYTGSPNGTFVLEASNQDVKFGTFITEWTELSGSSYGISSAGSTMWNYNGAFFRWVRVKYIYNSGSGFCSIVYTGKGA